jgi:Tetracyclin repressor-like, C-terminal domain
MQSCRCSKLAFGDRRSQDDLHARAGAPADPVPLAGQPSRYLGLHAETTTKLGRARELGNGTKTPSSRHFGSRDDPYQLGREPGSGTHSPPDAGVLGLTALGAVMGNDLQFEVRGDWREDLRSFAHGLRAMILHHPWTAVPSAGLRSLGPNTARRYEQVLGTIDGLGLEIDQMLVIVETLDAFVRGRALEEISEQEAVRRSGLDQEQWMQTQLPYIESLIESGQYPLLTRVFFDAHAPHDPDRLKRGFDLGLERVLDGLATMLAE